jgi:hypothetical protein
MAYNVLEYSCSPFEICDGLEAIGTRYSGCCRIITIVATSASAEECFMKLATSSDDLHGSEPLGNWGVYRCDIQLATCFATNSLCFRHHAWVRPSVSSISILAPVVSVLEAEAGDATTS